MTVGLFSGLYIRRKRNGARLDAGSAVYVRVVILSPVRLLNDAMLPYISMIETAEISIVEH
jgi:hypothetical protein